MDVVVLLVIGSLIVLLGFGGEIFFKKTDVPNVLWLMLFGVLLGQGFNVLDRQFLSSFVDLFSAIAIVVILFDGGLRMRVEEMVRLAYKGLVMMGLGVAFSITVTMAIMIPMGFGLAHSFLMALILCGTSSSIVIPLITRIRGVSEETKTLLSLESITDVFTVALAILLMRVMLLQTADLTASLVNIFNNAINGLFFGVVGGLLFIGIFRRISGEEFPYGVMLSIIFLFYSITEFAGGSGALAVFVMGIILANRKQITSVFRTTEVGSIPSMKIGEFILDMELTKTHAMISFFVRTFFFVYIGAIVAIDNVQGFMVGTLISLGLLTARVIFIAIVTYNRRISGFDRKIMTVMLPRGLSAAVLALLPYSMGIPDTEVFSDIVFTVILGTACIASIGTTIIKKF